MDSSIKSAISADENRNVEANEINSLIERGKAVFEDAGKFQLWFHLRNAVLGNEIPAELVKTPEGRQLVEDELTRIEYVQFV
ncbi:MAG: MbcA/ParS/Xre antitoxin family protein [Cytophagaceae bacterium]|nr:MbcA/ParS/Xre antitoxin family protein [Cytophagaceae bacterium]